MMLVCFHIEYDRAAWYHSGLLPFIEADPIAFLIKSTHISPTKCRLPSQKTVSESWSSGWRKPQSNALNGVSINQQNGDSPETTTTYLFRGLTKLTTNEWILQVCRDAWLYSTSRWRWYYSKFSHGNRWSTHRPPKPLHPNSRSYRSRSRGARSPQIPFGKILLRYARVWSLRGRFSAADNNFSSIYGGYNPQYKADRIVSNAQGEVQGVTIYCIQGRQQ